MYGWGTLIFGVAYFFHFEMRDILFKIEGFRKIKKEMNTFHMRSAFLVLIGCLFFVSPALAADSPEKCMDGAP